MQYHVLRRSNSRLITGSLALLAVVLVLFFWGCVLMEPTATPTPTPTATPTPSPTPTPIPPEVILVRSGEALAGLTSFHFRLKHSEGAGIGGPGGILVTTVEGDVVRPDRMRATLEGTAFGSFVRLEVVIIGETTYMTDPLIGAWQTYPRAVSPVAFFKPDEGIRAALASLQGPRRLNDEQVAGRWAYHLAGELAPPALESMLGVVPGESVTAEFWVDQERWLLLQIKLVGRLMEEEPPDVERTLELSAFDSPVDIQPPQ